LLPAPAAARTFPTISLRILPRMSGPLARRSHEVRLPVSTLVSSAFSKSIWIGFPLHPSPTTSREGGVFELADISLCSNLRVCSPPMSSLPLLILQGSRGFYVRAERASLPLHAPDMLTVRIQAIDGARTFTLLDSQPCRLLHRPTPNWFRTPWPSRAS
jgi:hypothetical protein